MAKEALGQFCLDAPRVDLWINGRFCEFLEENATQRCLDLLFRSMGPCAAWRAVDVISQGTLATWCESAGDTYARGKNEHLISRGRQRIDVDAVNNTVRIEKEFVVITVGGTDYTLHHPKRLYLEFDCKGRRPVKSTWQHDLRDGLLVKPFQ